MITFLFYFFFQSEDGIRDVAVTGVQTCALPILDISPMRNDLGPVAARGRRYRRAHQAEVAGLVVRADVEVIAVVVDRVRSEERRVGKEWIIVWVLGYLYQ